MFAGTVDTVFEIDKDETDGSSVVYDDGNSFQDIICREYNISR